MSLNIAEILNDPKRNWKAKEPASKVDITKLIRSCEKKVPEEYLALLGFCSGGEGDLALPPLIFFLSSIDEVLEMLNDPFFRTEFPNFLFFGNNGGLEQIAFATGNEEPYPIVMIDPMAGPDSAKEIAPNIASFIQALGLEYAE